MQTKHRRTSALTLLALVSTTLPAAPLPMPLPVPDCRLTLRAEDVDMESFIGTILRIEGCLRLAADPATNFQPDPAAPPSVSLQLIHRFDPEAAIRLFVFPDSGPTRFSASALNRLLADLLLSLPPGFTGALESPFSVGRNSGPAIAGYISSQASLRIIQSQQDGSQIPHRVLLCAVPIADSGRILLVALSCKESLFNALNPAFDKFIRSIHLPEN